MGLVEDGEVWMEMIQSRNQPPTPITAPSRTTSPAKPSSVTTRLLRPSGRRCSPSRSHERRRVRPSHGRNRGDSICFLPTSEDSQSHPVRVPGHGNTGPVAPHPSGGAGLLSLRPGNALSASVSQAELALNKIQLSLELSVFIFESFELNVLALIRSPHAGH